MAEQEYVRMMRESLEKKVSVLQQIKLKNREQNEILEDQTSPPEALDQNVSEKEDLINQMIKLDEGFETLYNRIRNTLLSDKTAHSAEIRKMQMLITEITDLSAAVKAQEQRNRNLAEQRFSAVASKAKEVRRSQQAVNTYYRNMMERNIVDPQFMDSKK